MTYPTRSRTARIVAGATGLPSKVTSPASGPTRPMSSRRKVDFPHPLGPISTVVRPGGTVSVSGPRAGRPANAFNTPCSANMTNREQLQLGARRRGYVSIHDVLLSIPMQRRVNDAGSDDVHANVVLGVSPSPRATWLEAATSVDGVMFREVAMTLIPRSTNAFTIPAPIPCEAPVTMAVFLGSPTFARLENVLASHTRGGQAEQKSASSTMWQWALPDSSRARASWIVLIGKCSACRAGTDYGNTQGSFIASGV